MADALIGATGFVGGNLLRQRGFDDHYHSRNIESLAGHRYDLLVCAGAPAEKWKANADPEADQRSLARLRDALANVQATRVVLISTIDVYPRAVDVDEDSPIDAAAAAPYGRHRLELEEFVRSRFDATVIRLPGLFGPGLKKNVIYDFLHDNRLEVIDSGGVFQFYDLANLWKDVQSALDQRLGLVNFATEPTSVEEVAQHGFGREFVQRLSPTPARYDMRSRYDQVFGGHGGYLYDKASVLTALHAFVTSQQGRA